jgi:hypothetical protein
MEKLFERKSSGCSLERTEIMAVGARHADHVAPSIMPKSGGLSVGIVRSRTLATESISCYALKNRALGVEDIKALNTDRKETGYEFTKMD